MPTPVSLTSMRTRSFPSPSALRRVRTDSVPPVGIASTALKIRFVKRIADLVLRSHDIRHGFRQLHAQIDHYPALLRQIAPARPRQLDDLPDGAIEVYPLQGELRLALAVEFAHSRHGSGHVLDGPLNRRQIAARAVAQVGFALEKRFGIQRHGRNGIVDVVGDAAGHLPEGRAASPAA